MTLIFNNIPILFNKKKDNCDIFVDSDHYPIINNNDNIKSITFNTQHCYLKYKNCKIREQLDDQFCNVKDNIIIYQIKEYTTLENSYDFIFLQEVSHQLLQKLLIEFNDIYYIESTTRAISNNKYKDNIKMNASIISNEYEPINECYERDYTIYTVTLFKKDYTFLNKINIESDYSNKPYSIKSNQCNITETMFPDGSPNEKIYRNLLLDVYNKETNYILINLHYRIQFRNNDFNNIGTLNDNIIIELIKYLNTNYKNSKLPIIIIAGDYNEATIDEYNSYIRYSNDKDALYTSKNLISYNRYNLFLNKYYQEYNDNLIQKNLRYTLDRIYYFKPKMVSLLEKSFFNSKDQDFVNELLLKNRNIKNNDNIKKDIIEIFKFYLNEYNNYNITLSNYLIYNLNKIINLCYKFYINLNKFTDLNLFIKYLNFIINNILIKFNKKIYDLLNIIDFINIDNIDIQDIDFEIINIILESNLISSCTIFDIIIEIEPNLNKRLLNHVIQELEESYKSEDESESEESESEESEESEESDDDEIDKSGKLIRLKKRKPKRKPKKINTKIKPIQKYKYLLQDLDDENIVEIKELTNFFNTNLKDFKIIDLFNIIFSIEKKKEIFIKIFKNCSEILIDLNEQFESFRYSVYNKYDLINFTFYNEQFIKLFNDKEYSVNNKYILETIMSNIFEKFINTELKKQLNDMIIVKLSTGTGTKISFIKKQTDIEIVKFKGFFTTHYRVIYILLIYNNLIMDNILDFLLDDLNKINENNIYIIFRNIDIIESTSNVLSPDYVENSFIYKIINYLLDQINDAFNKLYIDYIKLNKSSILDAYINFKNEYKDIYEFINNPNQLIYKFFYNIHNLLDEINECNKNFKQFNSNNVSHEKSSYLNLMLCIRRLKKICKYFLNIFFIENLTDEQNYDNINKFVFLHQLIVIKNNYTTPEKSDCLCNYLFIKKYDKNFILIYDEIEKIKKEIIFTDNELNFYIEFCYILQIVDFYKDILDKFYKFLNNNIIKNLSLKNKYLKYKYKYLKLKKLL